MTETTVALIILFFFFSRCFPLSGKVREFSKKRLLRLLIKNERFSVFFFTKNSKILYRHRPDEKNNHKSKPYHNSVTRESKKNGLDANDFGQTPNPARNASTINKHTRIAIMYCVRYEKLINTHGKLTIEPGSDTPTIGPGRLVRRATGENDGRKSDGKTRGATNGGGPPGSADETAGARLPRCVTAATRLDTARKKIKAPTPPTR